MQFHPLAAQKHRSASTQDDSEPVAGRSERLILRYLSEASIVPVNGRIRRLNGILALVLFVLERKQQQLHVPHEHGYGDVLLLFKYFKMFKEFTILGTPIQSGSPVPNQ